MTKKQSPADLKIILLGDSAVGKSKLMERFLLNDYETHQDSTYALTLYRYVSVINGNNINVDFWDTAGYIIDHNNLTYFLQSRTVPEYASQLLYGGSLLYTCLRCYQKNYV